MFDNTQTVGMGLGRATQTLLAHQGMRLIKENTHTLGGYGFGSSDPNHVDTARDEAHEREHKHSGDGFGSSDPNLVATARDEAHQREHTLWRWVWVERPKPCWHSKG